MYIVEFTFPVPTFREVFVSYAANQDGLYFAAKSQGLYCTVRLLQACKELKSIKIY